MASSSGPPPEEEEMSHDEAEARLQAMRQAVQEQMRQINILEMDSAEHRLVLEALEPLDAGRKCFRMVGTVIVERTVADVKPALQKNLEQVSTLPPAVARAYFAQGDGQPVASVLGCAGCAIPTSGSHKSPLSHPSLLHLRR
jgi:chaperonin cofactor prefoldin